MAEALICRNVLNVRKNQTDSNGIDIALDISIATTIRHCEFVCVVPNALGDWGVKMKYHMHEQFAYLTDDNLVEAQQVAWKLLTYYEKSEKDKKDQDRRKSQSYRRH